MEEKEEEKSELVQDKEVKPELQEVPKLEPIPFPARKPKANWKQDQLNQNIAQATEIEALKTLLSGPFPPIDYRVTLNKLIKKER